MTKVIRLDNLIGLPVMRIHITDRILDSNMITGRVNYLHKKFGRFNSIV